MTRNSSFPQQPPAYKQPCSNKRQKKRVLSGQLNSAAATHTTTKATKPKPRAEDLQPRLESLTECFADLPDPRLDRQKRHLLLDIIVIALLAVLANADTWKDIAIWGQSHHDWLASFLALPNGIPSRDTFRRTISRLDPQAFQAAFMRWLRGLRQELGGLIAIDGKTLRGSGVAEQNPLHLVSAWASEQHLILGQQQVEDKSNEITAIPLLLQLLEFKGAIVTIDAMGCQKEIIAAIIGGKGNYCVAVKGNQPTLEEAMGDSFNAMFERDQPVAGQQECVTQEAKRPHGRVESRCYYTLPAPEKLRQSKEWVGVKSIGLTITYRGEGKEATDEGEIRYYVMSFASNVKKFARAVRGHWGIENSLHWVLDVTFGEDGSRIHKDHGGENVGWLRRLAITLLKNDTTRKDSIRAKRIRAGYDINYLQQIINAIPLEI